MHGPGDRGVLCGAQEMTGKTAERRPLFDLWEIAQTPCAADSGERHQDTRGVHDMLCY